MSLAMVHGGALAAACRAYGGNPSDWLDLSTGINPNPVAFRTLAPETLTRLPDSDAVGTARAAAARYYRVSEENPPLPVPGTQAAIQALPRLLGRETGRVAIAGPTYNEYARVFAAAGWQVDGWDLMDDPAGYDAAVLVNPNNPDGRQVPYADVLSLADRLASGGGRLIVDEAFADWRPSLSAADAATGHPGLVVLRSFGKFFGLAGLRLGFVIADRGTMEKLDALLGPWAVSGPALAIAADVLSDRGKLESVRERIEQCHAATKRALINHGLEIVGDGGLFLLVEDRNAPAIHDALCRAHILVRSFDYKPVWLRFGLVANGAEADRLATALAGMRALKEA